MTRRDLRKFVMFPYRFYKKMRPGSAWVPPLLVEEKELHDKNRHPFHKVATVDNFLAYRNGNIVGRISAIWDPRYLEYRKQNAGYFGFFECIDDASVSNQLFRTVEQWCAQKGLDKIIGPINPTPSHILGCLLNDYENPPVIQIPYNPPYYPRLIEAAGYEKEEDHFAYIMDENAELSEKVIKVAEYAKRRGNITLRNPDMKHFDREADLFKEIWNDAWADNADFVPWTDAEFDRVAEGLKQIIVPDLAFFAYVNGEPAGVSVALPNLNEILFTMNGRLLPFGIFKLLFGMKRIKTLRFIGLGIKEKFKNRGIDALFAVETYRRGRELGYEKAEFSLILEENVKLRRALEGWGAWAYRGYRVYGKKL